MFSDSSIVNYCQLVELDLILYLGYIWPSLCPNYVQR